MPFTLPELPFAKDALAPHMSAETFNFHYGKHHNAYVTKLNELVAGTPFEGQTLEEIINATRGKEDKAAIFNNAAQTWNHTFFWKSLSPLTTAPTGKLLEAIERQFGTVEEFKAAFLQAAIGQFGSGWVWLVKTPNNTLEILKTPNAQTPIGTENTPLLTLDVWEHAYYLDYQNRRPDFATTFLDKLANWSHAEELFIG